jgi:cob(I)alamin adenosyltransferase
MERRREVQRQRVGERNLEKGLVLVFTGDGKGKTTAALGLVLRTLGHGERVAVLQFIKGGWQPGEAKALALFGEALHWHALGEGFTWETQDRARDVAAAERAWAESARMLADPSYAMVILDEINIALRYEQIPLGPVLDALAARPAMQHVVATGRNAASDLIELADLVTEMTLVKHPFRDGIKAQKGVEF